MPLSADQLWRHLVIGALAFFVLVKHYSTKMESSRHMYIEYNITANRHSASRLDVSDREVYRGAPSGI